MSWILQSTVVIKEFKPRNVNNANKPFYFSPLSVPCVRINCVQLCLFVFYLFIWVSYLLSNLFPSKPSIVFSAQKPSYSQPNYSSWWLCIFVVLILSNLGHVLLGLFWNRNSWNDQKNPSFLGLSWLQTCQNQFTVSLKVLQSLWNQSSPRTNSCLAYSSYSYSRIGSKECTLSLSFPDVNKNKGVAKMAPLTAARLTLYTEDTAFMDRRWNRCFLPSSLKK